MQDQSREVIHNPGRHGRASSLRIFSVLLACCSFFEQAPAGDIGLTWENATEYENGEPIAQTGDNALSSTIIHYSLCQAGDLDLASSSTLAVDPTLTATTVVGLDAGEYCLRATHVTFAGEESDYSNLASKIIPADTPADELVTVADLVYNVVKTRNRFVLLPAGTVPIGTPCDAAQSVNGYHVVDAELVTWATNARPLVVVAECSGVF